ncbi:Lrp/AsnC family transcriptional regulator [Ornithinimicrobium pratense]|uniref:Lrp/AsnC family transcriptional regulator n=1 Tax=Ornithinimicrobium pratense TaxID=2593973 RepID=A0A5J6V8R2_9MICO|nr:Lrp/AsnC family transcriptional regulator [Ornithinimicrobium pratense]QFG69483.1 Lrp/AsnC family transcriptional regulator [Ornithinimicrobium pratense]
MADERLDDIDVRILRVLSAHPRASVTRIAELARLARGTVNTRLARMESILSPYERRVPPASLGLTLTAFVQVQAVALIGDELATGLADIPEVIEAFGTSGDWSVLVRIAAHDAADLYRVNERIQAIAGVERTALTLAMRALVAPRMAPLLDGYAAD